MRHSKTFEYRYCEPKLQHHKEHFDGSGYPNAIKAETIPHCARVAVIVIPSLPSSRSAPTGATGLSKPPQFQAGRKYDPALIEVFLSRVVAAGWEIPK